MALLTLKDIGKIYVSENNVAVGIRGVNLSFERGEFVAVTGKSGSGKSTLLNVISGMDSYEEGELYIDGQTTSHYLQPEWEEYRQRYISFIFQDYNIIDSFTVLENVELALMHVEDKAARRARALELIERVGLSSHIKHKGSKLSGGQKQRTVIARALAKDSPIILADEPTGNLDSKTSREIIALLREVSYDKLVIVVTHSFDEVAEYATRHVRIYDGAVESDHILRDSAAPDCMHEQPHRSKKDIKEQIKRQIQNGFTLGRSIFCAKPRLSVFLCLLMLIGTMGIFLVTAMCGEAGNLFEPSYMFHHIDGRLVLAKRNGQIFTDEELENLVQEYGAESYLHFDQLIDEGSYNQIIIPCGENEYDWEYAVADNYVYGKDYGEVVGRYPEQKNEVLLCLPISYRTALGKDTLNVSEVQIGLVTYRLSGVKYFYDNNQGIECLFTEDGFRTATAIHFLMDFANYSLSLEMKDQEGSKDQLMLYQMIPSFDMPRDKIYINSKDYRDSMENDQEASTAVKYQATYYKYNYDYLDGARSYVFERTFTDADITNIKPEVHSYTSWMDPETEGIIISDELLCEIAEGVLMQAYTQASLFFTDDRAAHAAAERLQEAGYIAVPSDTTYEPDGFTVILSILGAIMMGCVWVMAIAFLAFFINLCSSRVLGTFRSDMAIMRSMGIEVRVIQIGMYVRMLIALIPAFILVMLTAVLIFTTPAFNEYFTYLYTWQYVLIFVGMIFLTVMATHQQIRRLFGQSVKKSLKGGSAE